MSEFGDIVQGKCDAFADRVVKLNDYLLTQAANKKPSFKMVNGKKVYEKPIPVYLQSITNICNQLMRAGTSVGANNAEATSAISKADYKSKSYDDRDSSCHVIGNKMKYLKALWQFCSYLFWPQRRPKEE